MCMQGCEVSCHDQLSSAVQPCAKCKFWRVPGQWVQPFKHWKQQKWAIHQHHLNHLPQHIDAKVDKGEAVSVIQTTACLMQAAVIRQPS
jgi:hypothetical protein